MTVVALLYHCVRPSEQAWPGDDLLRLSVGDHRFREQLKTLAANAEVLELSVALRHGPSLERSRNLYVTITFDDAYARTLELAQAAIRDTVGVPATVFVPAAHCAREQPYWWDVFGRAHGVRGWRDAAPADPAATLRELRGLRYAEAEARVLDLVRPEVVAQCPDRAATWAELAALDHEHLRFGSHGWWHENLSLLSLRELDHALREAHAAITGAGLPTVSALAYPFGRESDITWEQIREVVGLRHAYGLLSEAGRLMGAPATNPLALRRVFADDIPPEDLLRRIRTVAGQD
ncbi:polysaccharide deacetylase family protein [Crossiella cryophila]|uniref:Peptidoglycan/xylan/chitin deacetylase (PgdA/CDA1 family) n=1 Tax=Crossiella cryophila TaxID=43355 RepID=A0A7W7FV13_9PSEU|nr:polysaccharide deacetylase family protein [Crossiella cryophila]MBB4678787.1 peptidoglycan/xylan/chitin deacetylase (PgdA/CDA1 family) [Crossiella cryophila]